MGFSLYASVPTATVLDESRSDKTEKSTRDSEHRQQNVARRKLNVRRTFACGIDVYFRQFYN